MGLLYAAYDTSLQGTKLLGKGLSVEKDIEEFINESVAKRSLPWSVRKSEAF